MKYLIHDIARIISGTFISRGENQYITHLLTDSRKLIFPSESLFFALQSNRRKGADFIPELYIRGVRNFVVEEEMERADEFPGANILLVANSLSALQELASHHRNSFSLPVIGITGSNGKTIVKEWLNQLLADKYNIVRSPRSYNSKIGVPLSVWQINEHHQLGIFEAGISERNEMDILERIIRPSIGIFTNIGFAHSEGFHDLREKIKEKIRLFSEAEVILYCRDHEEIDEALKEFSAEKQAIGQVSPVFLDWSTSRSARLRVNIIERAGDHTVIEAEYGPEKLRLSIPFSDSAYFENACHCLCLMLYLEVEKDDIVRGISALGSVPMRLELKKGINHCSVINDSYSADLSSLEIALDFLGRQQQHSRRTVIITDIPEAGIPGNLLYERVASSLAIREVNKLIGIGNTISSHSDLFRQAGIPECIFFSSAEHFREHLPLMHFHNEAILVKGARKFGLESIVHFLEEKVHETVMEINLDSLLHNLRQFQKQLKPETKVMAMVKAFSYGSGSFEIANALQFHKVDYLAVAYADEGVDLRKGGIWLPVMVMNIAPEGFDALVEFNLEPVIYSLSILKSFNRYLKREGIRGFPIHVELETGMNRLGFPGGDIPELISILREGHCILRSVFTHLAASEDPSHDSYTEQQASIFERVSSSIEKETGYSFLKHISNSSAAARHYHLQYDMVRLGIGLYGIDVAGRPEMDLKEVSTLKSTIAQIKQLDEGETVGYGRRGIISRPSTIATIRIGYADGYPRQLSNGRGRMLVNGQPAPVIGTICMDMTMIDITGIPDVKEGDEVILFGPELPVSRVAEWAETIPYEILTGISQRVKRVYYQE